MLLITTTFSEQFCDHTTELIIMSNDYWLLFHYITLKNRLHISAINHFYLPLIENLTELSEGKDHLS